MKINNCSAWLEINLDNIKKNIIEIRGLVKKNIQIMGVVKGNAYGHDAIEISKIILENGANSLAVARIEEAILLRKNNINQPILVLGVSPAAQTDLYFRYPLIMPTICDLEKARYFNEIGSKCNKKIQVHLKIETGMSRLGINVADFNNFLKTMLGLRNIEISGVYTHFSTADELVKEYTKYQFNNFQKVKDIIEKNGNISPLYHVANSGTILDLPNMWLDMVRPGCLLYGLYPSCEVKKTISLHPALTFKSRVAFIKKIEKGQSVGYGKDYKTDRMTTVATLPVGYADGYSRFLSNKGKVIINGEKVPVIGRVCMDQMMVDVTDLKNINIDDEVILWGSQENNSIPVEEIADGIGTIVDEIVHLTDKNRVAKIFIKDGKYWKAKTLLGEFVYNET